MPVMSTKKKSTPKRPTSRLTKPSLRQINIGLLVVILLINGYIFGLPLVPRLNYLWRQSHDHSAGLPYQSKLAATSSAPQATRQGMPQDNRLVIPKLVLNQAILQGTSPYTVNKGVWARPKTSTPPNGGNTVLVGHRYTYTSPSVFYDLDKVSVGDNIIVYWQGREYDYVVRTTKVVPATDVAVENNTSNAQLTLYTCTPFWSFTERLVIVADLQATKEAH
jgi:LPXTG-site transpeptidase (sortase) family protein